MRRTRIAALVGVAALMVAAVSGCSVSNDTKGYASEALCASSSGVIQNLKGSGAAARAAASLIRDNTDDSNVKGLAQKVIDGKADQSVRDDLSAWLKKTCQ